MSLPVQTLTETVSTYSQVYDHDFAALAKAGFKTIICNRPDGEEIGQPEFAQLEQAAKAHDITMIHLPLQGGAGLSLPLIEGMQSALDGAQGPVLAYCKTGMRSAVLWCFAMAPTLGVDGVLSKARAAGFELSQFSGMLEQFCAQNSA